MTYSNVGVGIYTPGADELIKKTNDVLKEIEIYPKVYLRDGYHVNDEHIVVVQSISRMLFSCLQDFDITDTKMTRFYSCGEIFKKAVELVPELNAKIIKNALVFQTSGRSRNLKFNPAVFDPLLLSEVFKNTAKQCPTLDDYESIKKYLGTMFDGFRILSRIHSDD